MTDQVLESFWDKVKVDDVTQCWNWQGCLNSGYGVVRINNVNMRAHRVAYEVNKVKIPEGLTLDHLCRNRKCVNPEHLEVVTRGENVLRGIGLTAINAKKTHCSNGHELSGDNLYLEPSGGRACRLCRRKWNQDWLKTHPTRSSIN